MTLEQEMYEIGRDALILYENKNEVKVNDRLKIIRIVAEALSTEYSKPIKIKLGNEFCRLNKH